MESLEPCDLLYVYELEPCQQLYLIVDFNVNQVQQEYSCNIPVKHNHQATILFDQLNGTK